MKALILGIASRNCNHLPMAHGGSFFLVVVVPTILYQGWIQRLASHYSIVESDGKDGDMPPFNNSRRYFTTQSLVEDGIPSSLLWQWNE